MEKCGQQKHHLEETQCQSHLAGIRIGSMETITKVHNVLVLLLAQREGAEVPPEPCLEIMLTSSTGSSTSTACCAEQLTVHSKALLCV